MDERNGLFFSSDTYRGIKGRVIAALMNAMHKKVHVWMARRIGTPVSVLDVGCGGGGLIAALLKSTDGKVYGIDYSPDMVRIARRRNIEAVDSQRVEITVASVSSLPFADGTFNATTAFETVQFWPDIVNDLKEVKRVLKPDGMLYIMNRLPKPQSKWYSRLPIKTAQDYADVLGKAGFIHVDIDTDSHKGWIVIEAK